MSDEGENWADYVEDSDEQQDDQSEGQIELENIFYSAEEMKDSNPKGAIEQYFLLLDSEEPMSEKAWSAKCINEIINIKIKKNDLDDMNEVIKKLLAYINNMSKYDRGITIDCIFNAVNKIGNLAKKKEAFETLLSFLKEKDMTVIWMTTSLKLARIYLSNNQVAKFTETLRELEACKELRSFEEIKANVKTLNIYCEIITMKIEKMLADKDLPGLRRLVDRSKKIKLADLASSDVKILSVLKEAEGVIALLEKNFEEAETCFKQAFQHYHEIGHGKTKDMLILNTVANILTGMSINPFSSPEAQMFFKDESVVPFNALWNANFEKNHLEFLAVLDSECNSELLRHFDLINELRKAILYGFLQKIISTYKTLSLDYLSRELRVPKATIVQILVEMIMDRKIIGLIDETLGVFINEAGNEQTQQNKRTVQLLNSMVKVVEEVTSRGTRGAPVSLASY